MLHYMVDRLLAEIAPWRCILCRAKGCGMDLCIDCLQDLPWLGPACRRCAIPITPPAIFCGRCQTDTPAVDWCIAALRYEYPIDRLINALKFNHRVYIARVLSELLLIRVREAVKTGLRLPSVIVPVPLHFQRQMQRGYNQAAEIAAGLAKELAIKMSTNVIERIRPTPAQSGLSKAARDRNVKGVFKICSSLADKRISIIDDVITTGATTKQLMLSCKQQGAKEVQVWAVARTDFR